MINDWKESFIVTIWKKNAADKGNNSKCIKLGLILENLQVKLFGLLNFFIIVDRQCEKKDYIYFPCSNQM